MVRRVINLTVSKNYTGKAYLLTLSWWAGSGVGVEGLLAPRVLTQATQA